MLVLSRKQGEQIKIGEGITVTVLGVRGGVIKIGIDAPPHLRILRGELVEWTAETCDETRGHHSRSADTALAV
jgi:carbon storage regulator